MTTINLEQVELGKGLGANGHSIQSLQKDGYEGIFIGIGRIYVTIYVMWQQLGFACPRFLSLVSERVFNSKTIECNELRYHPPKNAILVLIFLLNTKT